MNTAEKVATGIGIPLAIGAAVLGGIYAYNAGTRGKNKYVIEPAMFSGTSDESEKAYQAALRKEHDYQREEARKYQEKIHRLAKAKSDQEYRHTKAIERFRDDFHRMRGTPTIYEDDHDDLEEGVDYGGKRRRKTRSKRHGKSRTHKKRR